MSKSILDPSFKYTSSARTDLKATFRRLRKELREADEAKLPVNVAPIKPVIKMKGNV